MTRLVEYPLQDGSTILVEVEDLQRPGIGRVARGSGGEIIDRAKQTFEQVVASIRPAANAILAQLRSLATQPDEIEVEFGLGISGEAGAFIAKASTEANIKVTLTWKAAEAEKK